MNANNNPYASPKTTSKSSQPHAARNVLDLGRLILGLILLGFSFRTLALPLLDWLSVRRSDQPQHIRWLPAAILLLVLASPVDIGNPALARVRGNKAPGVRVVRVVRGMPAHTSLVARYGE